MSEDKKAEIQSLLLALINALTPETPTPVSDETLRQFILAQITDYSRSADEIEELADRLFWWVRRGKRAKADLKAVKP